MTKRVPTAISLCLVLGSLGACSGSQSKPEDASSGKHDSSPSAEAAEEDKTPLTPVASPNGVVVRMRIKNPSSLLDGLFEAASLPFGWRGLAEMSGSGEALMGAFDVEGAVEMAVVINARSPANPHRFISVGAQGVDPVLELLDSEGIVVQEAAGGVFLFAVDDEPCAVGRAIQGSPARVVCSDDEASLLQLLPYALRGLPGHELSDAAAYLEVDLRPIRETYGKKLRQVRLLASVVARQMHVGNAKYDTALTDAANGIVEEASALLEDTDFLKLQLFEESGAMRMLFTTEFSGKNSTIVQSALALEKVQGPAPAIFDALPSTASAASYGRELSAERVEPWLSVVADLLSGRAEFEGASEEFSTRLARLVRMMGPKGADYVVARGPLVESLRDGKKSLDTAWSLLGSDRKKEDIVRGLDDLSWLLASKERLKISPELKLLPSFRRSSKKLKGVPGAVMFQWTLPKEAQAMASEMGEDLEEEVSSELGDFSLEEMLLPFSKGFVAVHQVGKESWIAWGREESDLAESFRILELKDGEKLRDLGSIAGVRTESAVGAGYTKLGGLASSLAWLAPSEMVGGWSGLLRATPHRGSVPMVHFFKLKEQGSIELSWELRVPAEFTQDFATLLVMIAAELGAPMPGSSKK